MKKGNEIKKQMRSVNEIASITRATRLISRVRVRKARQILHYARPFFSYVAETMEELLMQSPESFDPILVPRNKKKGEVWNVLIYVMCGEEGLAGAYSLNVVKQTEETVSLLKEKRLAQGYEVNFEIRVIGRVGKDRLIADGYPVNMDYSHPLIRPDYYHCIDIADEVQSIYASKQADEIYFVFTHMENAALNQTLYSRILPADYKSLQLISQKTFSEEELLEAEERIDRIRSRPTEFVPNPNAVMKYLVSSYLTGMIYGIFSESYASEQNARMNAMEAASKNADELLARLKIQYNRSRQEAITQELSEIVSGAQSVMEQSEAIRKKKR